MTITQVNIFPNTIPPSLPLLLSNIKNSDLKRSRAFCFDEAASFPTAPRLQLVHVDYSKIQENSRNIPPTISQKKVKTLIEAVDVEGWTLEDAEAIRRNFVLALEALVERGAYVGIATHDELLVWEALRVIRAHSLRPEQYEFQMLLGVDEELRGILIRAGHPLRVYVPYGPEWRAYSTRRLRKNPELFRHLRRDLFARILRRET